MNIRITKESDYEDFLVKWWRDWRWASAPAKDMLPFSTGVVVSVDDVDVCVGFLYLTNSKCAWLEFIVSNIEVKDKEIRKMCIGATIKTLSDIAKNSGFHYIYTSLKNESLISAYEQQGFIKGSSDCLEMIKIIE